MLLAKLRLFCIRYFWRTKCKRTKKITEPCFSCQNKSVCQKLAWSCKKWKSAQKPIYALFAWRPSTVHRMWKTCISLSFPKGTPDRFYFTSTEPQQNFQYGRWQPHRELYFCLALVSIWSTLLKICNQWMKNKKFYFVVSNLKITLRRES